MAQMAAASGAMELGAEHAMAGVGGSFHRARQGIPEAGPAGAAFELGAGVEQLRAAAGTFELAGALFLVQRAGAGALGGMLALVYALLYGLVRSEDYALLMGSLAMLATVVALMALTRRVDWYATGAKEPA